MLKIMIDIREAISYFKARRFLRKSRISFATTRIENFNKPDMYIGTSDKFVLFKKFKIDPDTLETIPGGKTACLGYSPKTKKWYGWSHRAIYGFKIGDVVKVGDCTNTSGFTEDYLNKHPEEDLSLPVGFEAKTLEDCKRMAIAFAQSVS